MADDEKDSLDADAMIASIREGTEAANEERRRRGWSTMTILGWHEEPFYDADTDSHWTAMSGYYYWETETYTAHEDGRMPHEGPLALERREDLLDPQALSAVSNGLANGIGAEHAAP